MTIEQNHRRHELIDKNFAEGLSPEEALELERLQQIADDWADQQYAPLPPLPFDRSGKNNS